ncbi:OmpA family protein [Bacteriovorax sp. PP10]|uniref:OmpA family protein n=1 Tax=Bacteriovorax antarcticus TaxID=3088717 RepID=A0ABU5VR18_9BACT|nr:OmpA family protein [Bacteriovorax sp. PP10]MEA9355496.1 OmpA family protein [Bacteriovorax sp. PP10]
MFKKMVAVLALTAAFAQSASAYDLSHKFGLGISGGYSIPVFGNPFNSSADADINYGVYGRYHFNDSFNLEFGVSRSEFDKTDVRFDNINLLGVWRLAGSSDITPIAGLGVAGTRIKNFTPKSMKLSGLARLGVEFGITQWFSVGLLADYQYVSKLMGDMPNTKAHVVTPQLALTWYFGGSDNSASAYKEAEPAPMKEEVKEAPKAAALVDESQLDSDDDGVKDPEDRCPSTPIGSKVNSIGCSVEEKATMTINVEFGSGKSTLAPKYNDHMKEVATFLKKYSEVNVQIEGYTDNTGSEKKNIALSQARANAVMNALVKQGVAKSRLTAKGFGPADPIADNSTAEGRQTNRRVVAVLSSK